MYSSAPHPIETSEVDGLVQSTKQVKYNDFRLFIRRVVIRVLVGNTTSIPHLK